LYFLPDPQGHGSLRPTFIPTETGTCLAFSLAGKLISSDSPLQGYFAADE